MLSNFHHKISPLNALLSRFLLQNAILGFILGILIKQFFFLYQLPYFNYIEASLIFAFILGILSSGYFSETLGRKFLSNLSWAILSIALIMLISSHWSLLIWIGLAFAFFAQGVFITIFPIYVAECAPNLNRGAWVVGSFLALLLGVSIFSFMDFNLQIPQFYWPLSAIFLSVIALILNYGQPESPAWLSEQSRFEEARVVLQQLRAAEDIDKEIAVTKSSIRRRPGSWRQVYEHQLKTKLQVCRRLAFFRQLTGIGVMLFYLPYLFTHRWAIAPGAFWILIFTSLSTGLLFAAIYVDSVGRRKLMTISFIFQALILVLLGSTWGLNLAVTISILRVHELILLLSFLFFFALGSGPVTWLSWIELMPLRLRARHLATFMAMTLILGILIWLAYYFLINLMGIRIFYFVVALFSLVAAFYCWRRMPETKNYLLDEI